MDHVASETSHITISGCEMHHDPLVNICKHTKKKNMQHHHVEWVNQLFHTISTRPFSMATVMLEYQAGSLPLFLMEF